MLSNIFILISLAQIAQSQTFPKIDLSIIEDIAVITSLDSGNYGIVYRSDADEDLYTEIYDPDGNLASGPTFFDEDSWVSDIIRQPDGRIIVAFTIEEVAGNSDGDGKGVFIRRCDASFNCGTSADNVQINTHTSGNQRDPILSMYPDGSFTACWNSMNIEPKAYCQSFDEDLVPDAGGEILLIMGGVFAKYPLVKAFPDYSYVVTYKGDIDLDERYFIQKDFAGTVTLRAEEQFLPAGTWSSHSRPIYLSNGQFALSRRYGSPSGDQTSINLYNSTHTLISDKLLEVNQSGWMSGELWVSLANGSHLMLFRSTESGQRKIYLQPFNENFDYLRDKILISDSDASEVKCELGMMSLDDDERLGYIYQALHTTTNSQLVHGNLCTKNSHCDRTSPVCDYTSCSACLDDSACADSFPEYPVCNTGTGGCVESLELTVLSDFDSICSTGNFELDVQSSIASPLIDFNVYSASGDGPTITALEANLPDNSISQVFTIDINDFQPQDTYTFEGVSEVTSSVQFSTIASELFSLSDTSDRFVIKVDEAISASFDVESCMSSRPMTKQWISDESHGITITDYTSGADDTEIDIPACELQMHTSYNFVYEAYFDEHPSTTKTYELDVVVTSLPFTIEIDSGGIDEILSYEDITFTSIFNPECPVADPDDVLYKWSCSVADSEDGEYTSCEDPDELLDEFESSNDELTLSEDYHRPGQYIKVTLTVKVGENEEDSSTIIKISPFVQLELSSAEVRCSIKLSAEIDPYEYQWGYEFTWQQTNNPSSTSSLNSYLAKQTINSVIIPTNYIEVGVIYHFESSYVSYTGEEVVGVIELLPIPELPQMEFSGGSPQEIVSFQDFRIRAQAECMPAGIEIEWTQTAGPSIGDIEDFAIEGIPTELLIPKCSLKTQTDYQFQISLAADNEQEDYQIDISVVPDDFRVYVLNGDTEHLETEDLELSAKLVPEGECPIQDEDSITYEWQCYKLETSRDLTPSACSDPFGLFGTPSLNKDITIPNSYFSNRNTLQVQLIARNGPITRDYTSIISVKDKNILKLSLGCDSTSSCFVFSPQKNYRFTASLGLENTKFNDLSTLWSIDPIFPKESFINKLKTIAVTETLSPNDFTPPHEVSIYFIASNDTHKSSSEFILPLNFAPHSGDLSITPTEGQALSRRFTILASDWEDDNVPISYQFAFSTDINSSFRVLSDKISANSIKSLLTAKRPRSSTERDVTVYVRVTDPYDAKSTASTDVTLYFNNMTTGQAITQLTNLMDSIGTFTDPLQQIQQLSLISYHITGLDDLIDDGQGEDCDDCSGNGVCGSNGKCKCDEGYMLDHCQLPMDDFSQIIDAKDQILDSLSKKLEQIEDSNLAMNVVADVSSSPSINNDDTMTKSKDLVDEIIQVRNDSHLLEEETSVQASEIFDNMLSYSGKQDCNAEADLTSSLNSTTKAYVKKIAEGLLSDKIPGEEASKVENDEYQLIAQKLSECALVNADDFSINDDVPKIGVRKVLDKGVDCSAEVKFSYFAFKGNLFDCDGDNIDANPVIVVQVFDSAGKDITEDYNLHVSKRDEDDQCTDGCVDKGTKCLCEPGISSLFDLDSQISRIFGRSNLGLLTSNSHFESWRLYDNGFFWIATGCTLLSIASGIAVIKALPTFCMIDKMEKKGTVTAFDAFKTGFVLFHPLLNFYLINSMPPSKIYRCAIFYSRFLLMMAIVCLLGSGNTKSVGFRDLQSLSVDVDVYILLVPYVTFVPLELVLRVMLTKRSIEPGSSKFKKFCLNFIRYFGIFLMVVSSLLCLYIILQISENADSEENSSLLIQFAKVLAQDWIVTPLLLILIMYLVQDVNLTRILAYKENIHRNSAENSSPNVHTQKPLTTKKSQIVPLSLTGGCKDDSEAPLKDSPHPLKTTHQLSSPNNDGSYSGNGAQSNFGSEKAHEGMNSTENAVDTEHRLLTTEPAQHEKGISNTLQNVDLDDQSKLNLGDSVRSDGKLIGKISPNPVSASVGKQNLKLDFNLPQLDEENDGDDTPSHYSMAILKKFRLSQKQPSKLNIKEESLFDAWTNQKLNK